MAIPRVTLFTLLLLSLRDGAIANSNDVKIVNAVNDFGLNLYKELTKTHGNLFCSGFSFSVALNMLLVGARGNTATEIRSVLGYESLGLSQSDIEDTYKNLLTQQRSKHSGYEFDIANSMWIHSGYPVLPDFKSTLQNKFYAEEKEVTFGTQEATDAINTWVNDATKGKIPKLVEDKLDAFVRLVLVNAMFFKGTWVITFDKELTQDSEFSYLEGDNIRKQDVKMMNMTAGLRFVESNVLSAQLVELPYHGEEVSMILIVPFTNQPLDLSELEKTITTEKLNSALNSMKMINVHLRMPKFESSSTLDLNNALISLGINDAFGDADLSGIDGSHLLYVSKTIQKTVVEVSEEGTIAAAASAIVASTRSGNNEPNEVWINANRPFIYAIRHKPTGIFYFMGRFMKP